ncbi:putative eka-like protein [Erysiphe necator]|uniref:Putative eka-like protein n=1 Tax=Uncinula necator TaxID=52586 RepID=A0A0B1P5G2_UNCNE|nr:putative eka-like protein [Erysiphe necator]
MGKSCSSDGNQQRTTPPIPIPNSPPLIASPSPPSNLETPSKTVDSRQILKPVAPSKGPVTGRPTQNNRDKPEIENAFLPKELADIIAIRQRRERAWDARLQICTNMISSIDSTLANFKEEVEIEEIVAFKTFRRQIIANFAADPSSSPPLIPSHTRPNKGNGNSNHKDKDKNLKKVLVATPYIVPTPVLNRKKTQEASLPKNPPTNNNIWVTVARNGHIKARVVSPTNKTATSGADKRLFVWVTQEHEGRKLSPAGIREVLVRKLSISPTLIGRIKPVHSGFALSLCCVEAREAILNAGNSLFLTGAKLESATNWVPVIIPTVPSTIRNEQGDVEVSSSMLADEIERVCSVQPAHLKL